MGRGEKTTSAKKKARTLLYGARDRDPTETPQRPPTPAETLALLRKAGAENNPRLPDRNGVYNLLLGSHEISLYALAPLGREARLDLSIDADELADILRDRDHPLNQALILLRQKQPNLYVDVVLNSRVGCLFDLAPLKDWSFSPIAYDSPLLPEEEVTYIQWEKSGAITLADLFEDPSARAYLEEHLSENRVAALAIPLDKLPISIAGGEQ